MHICSLGMHLCIVTTLKTVQLASLNVSNPSSMRFANLPQIQHFPGSSTRFTTSRVYVSQRLFQCNAGRCRRDKEGTCPSTDLQRLGQADLNPNYLSLVTLRTLPDPLQPHLSLPGVATSSNISNHASSHMLVGALRKASIQLVSQQQLESQPQADMHAQAEGIDAVALWQVTLHPGQGQAPQPSSQEATQLSLRLCHEFEHSTGGPSCVVPVQAAGFQLLVGDCGGGIQLMSTDTTQQQARLVTVTSLPSALKQLPGVCLLISTVASNW